MSSAPEASGASFVSRSIAVVSLSFAIIALFVRKQTTSWGPWAIAIAIGVLGWMLGARITVVREPTRSWTPARARLPRTSATFVGGGLAMSLFVWLLRQGVSGHLSNLTVSILGTACLLVSIGAGALFIALHQNRAQWFSPTTFALGIATLVGFPGLGAPGLTDPWETHYAEVAREMLARDDAISPWWANEGWFHSKPVLLFWLEAASMRLFGAGFMPGHVLLNGSMHPEWAVRFPGFLCAALGGAILAYGVGRRFGRKAGYLGALLLWTTPFYVLMARQAITDMPLVSGIMAAVGCLLGRTDEGETSSTGALCIGRLRVERAPAHGLLMAITVLVGTPLFYIASRGGLLPFGLHADVVRSGSFGTCGALPDHPACIAQTPFLRWLSPTAQAALFGVIFVFVVYEVLRARKRRDLLLWGAYLAAAFAAAAKGPLGLVLPFIVFATDVVHTRRWHDLFAKEHTLGVLLAAITILPWYIATYARHGRLYFDDLVLRHMFGRALEHLHDVNDAEGTGVRYYVAQLGYGTVTWLPFVPLALRGALRDRTRLPLLVWALAAFAVVTIMPTKFHHYVFPAVPAIAMLVGIEFAKGADATDARERLTWLALGCALFLGVASDLLLCRGSVEGPARFIDLLCYRYDRAWPATIRANGMYMALLCLPAVASLLVLVRRDGPTWLAVTLGIPLTLYLALGYMPAIANHYGQRRTMEVFADARDAQSEPLVSYRLNWKGENYYSGNRTALFIQSGAPFASYMQERRARGRTTFYVETECSSIPSLTAELGADARVTRMTTDDESNRFCLVRADFRRRSPSS